MMTSAPAIAPVGNRPLWWTMALMALVLPTLVAVHEPPSVTFYNQALAVLGWGLFVAALGGQPGVPGGRRPVGALLALATVLGVVAVEALGASFLWGPLPAGLGMMGGGLCLSALLVLWTGWRCAAAPDRDAMLTAFFGALAVAGGIGIVLAVVQSFYPAWADGLFIAEPSVPGRAVGNLRQPNHFSTLLVFACCGAAWLGALRRVPAWLASLLVTLFIGGIVLTASRTGMLGMLFLTAWGALDRRLPKVLRVTLVAAPLIYWTFWGGMWLLSHLDRAVTFAAEERLHDKSDISSSRFKIWANVLELIKAHPWTGVGYGEFNIAWTLTPFPKRPVAFFDHTHSLPLQWAVEFGLPLAGLLSLLCLVAFWRLCAGLWAGQAQPQDGADPRLSTLGACGVMVAIACLHSLLEYPLWYSYFLLPTAFAWGLGLGVQGSQEPAAEPAPPGARPPLAAASLIGGLLMATMAIWCAVDYQSAVSIYAPRAGAGPLEQRIRAGQAEVWWSYQADYADVTSIDEDAPSKPPAAFRRTLFNLMDARLMVAYARSLAEHGEVDKARYVVQRLQEFHNAIGDEFMAVCEDQPEADEPPPFQCAPPQHRYKWRDLLP